MDKNKITTSLLCAQLEKRAEITGLPREGSIAQQYYHINLEKKTILGR